MAWPRSVMAAFAAVAALIGCDEGPSSNLSFTATPDVWSFVTAAAAAGPLFVDVRGNPFDAPDTMVSDEVLKANNATFTEPWLQFTADAERAGSKDVRLIWLLDPQSGFNADAVCAGEFPALKADRRVTEIRAVFCQRSKPLSAVYGWLRRPDTGGDANWRNLISQMSRQLLRGRG